MNQFMNQFIYLKDRLMEWIFRLGCRVFALAQPHQKPQKLYGGLSGPQSGDATPLNHLHILLLLV
jgi:hypothetical protein